MLDTATHVKLVKARLRQRRRAWERRRIVRLSALCAALCAALGGAIGTLTDTRPAERPGLSGSMLLHEDAGGYVLVGVLAFTAAVVLTVLCVHMRQKRRRKDAVEQAEGGEEG